MANGKRRRAAVPVGRVAVIGGAIVLVGGLWYIASVAWGVAFTELVPFVAPAALLGIGAGWTSHVMKPERWTWKTGRDAAITGALVLPPMIAMAMALMGGRPERVLSSIVRGSWVALAGGAIWGIGTWMLHRMERRTV